MELVYKNEKKLFFIALVISSIIWLALLAVSFGTLLIFLLIFYILGLFAHSQFISYVKGTGVKITQDQFPDLYKKLINACNTIEQETVPEAYLLRTDFFNALATRFLGRNYIVLFTDVVDALEDKPGAVDFYIGHELGHINRKHLLWGWFLAPAKFLPLLGSALCRAEEYTCDRYGVACCDIEEDITAAIATIAAGDTRWKTLNTKAYTQQVKETSGFWMSFNELTSDYPWLVKRLVNALAMKQGKAIKLPSRNKFAWLLAMFIPRFGLGAGGFTSLIMIVALIGILAAIAIPAYQDYTLRVQYTGYVYEAESFKPEVENYATIYQNWPVSMKDLGRETDKIIGPENKYNIGIYENGIIGVYVGNTTEGEEKFIIIQPYVEEGAVKWDCYGQNIPTKYLPLSCK